MDTKHPVQFITFESNKWKINEKCEKIIKNIKKPVKVISVCGRFRTGKSYIMNLFAGQPGFDLGHTTNAETKGIWMWTKEEEKYHLILLDTEGLYDPKQKGGKDFDTKIFLISVLLSSYFIYNILQNIDSTVIKELSVVTEFLDLIESSSSKPLIQIYYF
jgi:predicted GTPase